jgi:N-carbamoyl-L-amino-acid hydrolase
MLTITPSRLLDDLAALAHVGATPDGGISRPAMSEADVEGRDWFRQRVQADGFQFQQDGAGNQSAVLPADDPNARTLLFGSHLDTVLNGGRFDGALGTLAALEALRTIRDAGLKLPVHLEVISFTDEEGAVVGLLGSQALTGRLAPADLEQPRGGRDKLEAGMQRLGLSRESILSARRDPHSLLAFVELHIEQGTRLEEAHTEIGVVTAIVGIRSYWLRFAGQAAHAGTMPMNRRADALWGASDFVRRARELVMSRFSPGVMNCGMISAQPGAFNIVPADVRLALEFRHASDAQLDEMQAELLALAQQAARDNRLIVEIEHAGSIVPSPMDERVVQAIELAADACGLTHTRLLSFAGHDTQAVSKIVPSAMLFVPSVDGISHNPREFTHPRDVVNGANTLLNTVLALAERGI